CRCVVPEGGEIRDSANLLGGRLGKLSAATANVDAPQPTDAIQVTLAIRIVHRDTIGLLEDHGTAFLEGREIRPGMNEVIAVLLPDFLFDEVRSGILACHVMTPRCLDSLS